MTLDLTNLSVDAGDCSVCVIIKIKKYLPVMITSRPRPPPLLFMDKFYGKIVNISYILICMMDTYCGLWQIAGGD